MRSSAHLQERVKALYVGQGAFGVISGEAGIGKSRLMAELRKWIAGWRCQNTVAGGPLSFVYAIR